MNKRLKFWGSFHLGRMEDWFESAAKVSDDLKCKARLCMRKRTFFWRYFWTALQALIRFVALSFMAWLRGERKFIMKFHPGESSSDCNRNDFKDDFYWAAINILNSNLVSIRLPEKNLSSTRECVRCASTNRKIKSDKFPPLIGIIA